MVHVPRRDGPPSVHHVAARAGVSLATVSNVLNHPERVADSTAARVHDAIAELGYTPNRNARVLASGSSRSIGLVVMSLRNSLFSDMVNGAQLAARKRGFTLLIASSEDDLQAQGEHLAYLESARVSGILLASMTESRDQVELTRRHGRPVVYVNFAPETVDACSVVVDNEQAAFLAAEHLIACGCRRIGFVSARAELQPVALRRTGVLRAIAGHPGVELIDIDAGDIDPPGGTDAGARIAAMPVAERPDGVLGVTDLLAMAVVSELRAAGIRVPEDIPVSGCDHNSVAWGGAVPLTSVTMHGAEMGAAAVELLLEELTDPMHVHRTVVLGSELVPRESTLGRAGAAAARATAPSDPRRTEA
ncbi:MULTISPECIES: LacI family DNA-binding transcriptional regulator [Curtobacterium]|uniref:LacI family DNA-binding transcriptional regulator n=1 Tax=Curtobacterium TaxID=2034 RepID=UPI00188B0412|nr:MULTISPECIES: LacI family DNA-binding transcriptional regulator [Curtobacterium]MBF4602673.1 LacI family DNA-binding transcriptional regulator [Curtobacterium sp. VKM Ac-2884]MBT1624585.1 LacI family transcriptional regulator [Curtobacterium flaccumfaciens pv. oortii]